MQKIKVLPGKIYNNSSEKPVDVNAIPDFRLDESKAEIKELVNEMYYLSSGQTKNMEDALKLLRVLREQGVNAEIRTFGDPTEYIVIVDAYEKIEPARERLKRFHNAGLKNIRIFRIKNQQLDVVKD